MRLTLKQLKTWGACEGGYNWFKEQKDKRLSVVLPKLVKTGHFDWANWTVVRLMAHPQKVSYAIFAAEQALPLYEKTGKSAAPRKAIETAKAFLRGEASVDECGSAAYAAYAAHAAAAYAAASAAYAAYAADAADAAAHAADADAAAYAAAYAAYAADAADAAAHAADADAAAYAAAYAAGSARDGISGKCIEYAMTLLRIEG
jgi:hypothetical protein